MALRALGAGSVPVVARGGGYVFAQVIRDVVDFLELPESTAPVLSPSALAQRAERNLRAAIRFTRQMPDRYLENELTNRPRSWRVLMHHVFQIPAAFLDAQASGEPLAYEQLVAAPPESMRSSADIAVFGETVLGRFTRWWQCAQSQDFDEEVPVYFGSTTRHELLERTVWHFTQHARQVASLLEQVAVAPERPLGPADIEGLPLTERIWDEG